jgi:hypothetical protein
VSQLTLAERDGNYYLAVADWDPGGAVATLHLFMNEGGGTPLLGFPSDSHVWREFCPGYQDTPDGGPMSGAPAGAWTRPGTLCASSPFAPFPVLMFPTLAADGVNRLGVLDYEGIDPAHFHTAYFGNIAPRASSATFQTIDPLGSSFQPIGGVLLYHPAMTTLSPQSPDSCHASSAFFPVWIQGRFTTPSVFFTNVTL